MARSACSESSSASERRMPSTLTALRRSSVSSTPTWKRGEIRCPPPPPRAEPPLERSVVRVAHCTARPLSARPLYARRAPHSQRRAAATSSSSSSAAAPPPRSTAGMPSLDDAPPTEGTGRRTVAS
eukprot:1305506-Prymnesium_polylepis.1